jgi:hypothetical protein
MQAIEKPATDRALGRHAISKRAKPHRSLLGLQAAAIVACACRDERLLRPPQPDR